MTNDLHPVTPGQLAWLRREVAGWRSDGILTEEQAAAVLSHYRAVRRFDLSRLALGLGAAFVGVGLIWLVAANLENLSPFLRFAIVTAFWLLATFGAEALDIRAHTTRSPVVGAARGLAALAFGAVVMQAAQSLQVPAYEPRLMAVWAAGALLHAYAVRGLAPLVVGVGLGAGYVAWELIASHGTPLLIVLAAAVVAAIGFGAARLHDRTAFAGVWRLLGTLAALVGLFVAAIPEFEAGRLDLPIGIAVLAVAAVLLTGWAALRSRRRDLVELAVGPTVALLGYLLLRWSPETDLARVGAEGWAHAAASVAAYVVLAAGLAGIGVLRDDPRMTWLSVAGVSVFTTFQSFAVFARIIEGAWLFLVLGVVLAGTGWLADRARRQLIGSLEGEQS